MGTMGRPGCLPSWVSGPSTRWLLCGCLTLGGLAPTLAPIHEACAADPAAKKRAGQRFKEAEALFQKHAYVEAAQAFEEANSIAPHPAVLLNAINAWSLAGQPARAALLCQKIIGDSGADDKSKEEARSKLVELQSKVGRLNIRGANTSKITLDGASVQPGETFVDPGDHIIKAEVNGNPVQRKISVVAGSSQQVILDEPEPAPSTKSGPVSETPKTTSVSPQVEPPKKGLPPAVVYVGGVLTLGLAGVSVWSGLDTVQAKKDFDAKPNRTEADKEAGVAKQTRTNVLIGATAVTGLLTIGIGLFATNWGSGKKEGTALRIGPGSVALEGTF